MSESNCGNCRYSRPVPDDSADREYPLRCRRLPPARSGNGDVKGLWPGVHANGWCGEHAPANPETATQAAVTLARFVLLGDLAAAQALADCLRE